MHELVDALAGVLHILELALPAVAMLVGNQSIEHSLVRRSLQVGVERCVDAEPALMDLVAAVFFLEIAANLFGEPRCELVGAGLQRDFDRCGFCLVRFLGRDLSVFQHGVDHQVATLLRFIGVGDRRISAGGFWQTGQDGGLIEREITRALVEIKLRGRFEAIDAVAKIDLIAIHGEDLLLGESPLDLQREHDLLEFAPEGAVLREEKIARELHGQRGSAFFTAMRAHVVIHGAGHAPEVHAPVAVKIFVFDGDQSVAQNFGNVVVLHDDAALQREGADDLSFVVVQFGRRTGTVTFEFTDLRQVGRINDQQAGQPADDRSGDDQQRENHSAHELLARKTHGRQVGIQVFDHWSLERK